VVAHSRYIRGDGKMSWMLDIKEVTNITNGTKYNLLTKDLINCTNTQDGQKMALYTKNGELFVREVSEFNEKLRVMIATVGF
jgi:hypothetical protein